MEERRFDHLEDRLRELIDTWQAGPPRRAQVGRPVGCDPTWTPFGKAAGRRWARKEVEKTR